MNDSGAGTELKLANSLDARASRDRRRRLIGILLMCGAVMFFTVLDTIAKYLSSDFHTLQIVWARYTGAFLLSLAIFNPLTKPGLLKTKKPVLQIGRSVLLLVSTACNFLALRYLQLAETTSILFSTPFIVALLAGPILGEWVGWRRWVAIGGGFVGVIVILKPGSADFHPAVFLVLIGALCYAFYSIWTRILARHDSSETTLLYSNLVGFLVLTPLVPMVWSTPTDLGSIALMLVLGASGAVGHFLLIIAHRWTPAAVLSPFIYTQLVWTLLSGYFVFGDTPGHWTLVGAGIVVASGLYLLHRERVRGHHA